MSDQLLVKDDFFKNVKYFISGSISVQVSVFYFEIKLSNIFVIFVKNYNIHSKLIFGLLCILISQIIKNII